MLMAWVIKQNECKLMVGTIKLEDNNVKWIFSGVIFKKNLNLKTLFKCRLQ